MSRLSRSWGTPAKYPKQQRNRIIRTWLGGGAAGGAVIGITLAAKGAIGLAWIVVATVALGLAGGWIGARQAQTWQIGIRAEHQVGRHLQTHSRRHMRRSQTWWGWTTPDTQGGDIDAVYGVQDTGGNWRLVTVEIKAGDGPIQLGPQNQIQVGQRRRRNLAGNPIEQAAAGRRRLEKELRKAQRERRNGGAAAQVGAVVAIAWGTGKKAAEAQDGRRVLVCGADQIVDALTEAATGATPLQSGVVTQVLTSRYRNATQDRKPGQAGRAA